MFSYNAGTSWFGIMSDLEIGKLPALRVIALESLVLHERPDEERWKDLLRRIRSDGLLRHPPIAARDQGEAAHLLLDGVNRIEALRRLGARWALVQEVDLNDERVVLSTWHHALEGLDGFNLLEWIRRSHRVTEGQSEFDPTGDFVPHYEGDTVCLIVLPDRSTYAVHAEKDLTARLETVSEIVDLVHTASNRDRVSYTNVNDLKKHYWNFSTLVCYRSFTKQELLTLSLQGLKFPSGVTRFSVPKRVLYFDVPLSFLKEGDSIEGKRAELVEIIGTKIKEKKIRFYTEPTFIFDD
ncbi:MAG: hypothetical protein JSV33_06255 [bacterium]|nr:MAG: hypothetical protein JSV33_06255 [bacterium]